MRKNKRRLALRRVEVQSPPEPAEPPEEAKPLYPQPQVLLIDLGDETEAVLRAEGYNVSSGTLGTPFKVERSNKHRPIPLQSQEDLPLNFYEYDVVMIDLAYPENIEELQQDEIPA